MTQIEAIGLKSLYDLANGHASNELTSSQNQIIDTLDEIWFKSAQQKSKDAEMIFKDAFLTLANTPSLTSYPYFKICPTASNSIDIVAAWLFEQHYRTALIEPTFDNLYLILKRRGVSLSAFNENDLLQNNFHALLDSDAIFMVNPNNPTGKIITQELFIELITWCQTHKKSLLLIIHFAFLPHKPLIFMHCLSNLT